MVATRPGHHLEILPLSRHRWIVRYEGDVTPLSEHRTLSEARAAAINHARQNFAGPPLAGQVAGAPLDVFVAGDDEAAKATVMRLVSDGGMRAINAGHLVRARELEALALLHLEIQGSRGAGLASAIKVIP